MSRSYNRTGREKFRLCNVGGPAATVSNSYFIKSDVTEYNPLLAKQDIARTL